MRRACLGFLLLLSACKQEPTFDEKFDATEQALQRKADDMDKSLATPAAETTVAPK